MNPDEFISSFKLPDKDKIKFNKLAILRDLILEMAQNNATALADVTIVCLQTYTILYLYLDVLITLKADSKVIDTLKVKLDALFNKLIDKLNKDKKFEGPTKENE